ncbi:hypothetical protein F5884DRAFT_53407 [Xylogone sp. PMI_703]|nr:hypothetical protein F5884DRAFT_53407 [Xylogone sp. PMI_703]
MGDDKGKGRAPDEREDEKGSNDAAPDSLFSRVVASATGLTKSTFAAPANNEVKDAAVTASTTSGKGHIPAGSGNSAWAESSEQAQHNAPSSNQARGAPSSFRLGHSEEHVRNAELEFSSFLDGIDTSKLSGPDQDALVTGQALGPILGRADSQLPVSAVSQPITVAEQERLDGAEVVAILSGSNTTSDVFEAPGEDEESFDWGLSEEQLSQIRAITKDLFPPFEPHGSISADNPLNLNPSFVDQYNVPRIDSSANESYMYFGVSGEPGAVRQMWREQWDGVLTRYADEVWGGLLPLVKEARKEVEEMGNAEGSESQEPKALRRLAMILSHLRK